MDEDCKYEAAAAKVYRMAWALCNGSPPPSAVIVAAKDLYVHVHSLSAISGFAGVSPPAPETEPEYVQDEYEAYQEYAADMGGPAAGEKAPEPLRQLEGILHVMTRGEKLAFYRRLQTELGLQGGPR